MDEVFLRETSSCALAPKSTSLNGLKSSLVAWIHNLTRWLNCSRYQFPHLIKKDHKIWNWYSVFPGIEGGERQRERNRDREGETEREGQRDRHREAGTERHKQRDRETDTKKER